MVYGALWRPHPEAAVRLLQQLSHFEAQHGPAYGAVEIQDGEWDAQNQNM